MTKKTLSELSKRERQIIEIIITRGKVTAQDLESEMPEKLSNSTIRTLLRILVQKNVLTIEKLAGKYLYKPVFNKEDVKNSAIKNLFRMFFGNSPFKAVSSLIDSNNDQFSEKELDELESMIKRAKDKRDKNTDVKL